MFGSNAKVCKPAIRLSRPNNVTNQGVPRYRELANRHLEIMDAGSAGDESVYLAVQTTQSHIRMVQAARTRAFRGEQPASLQRSTSLDHGVAQQRLVLDCRKEEPLRVEKVVAVLEHLVEGVGVRKTSRLVGVTRNTVVRYSLRAGAHAQQLHDELVAFSPGHRRSPVR